MNNDAWYSPMKYALILILTIFNHLSHANCDSAKDTSRVVAAGGSITETIYFLELQEKLVAVDTTSNFPEEAKKFPSIGYVRALAAEGILSLNPTLILGEDDMGPSIVLNQIALTSTELRIIEEDFSATGIRNKINCIANIFSEDTNSNDNYDRLLDAIVTLNELAISNSRSPQKIMFILMMRGTSPIVAGKYTSGDGLIKMAGGQNVMDDFDGWKPVSAEAINGANPDYIIITERAMNTFSSVESFSNQPSVAFTRAATKGNIIVKDGMSLIGFGPRTVTSALEIAKIIGRSNN